MRGLLHWRLVAAGAAVVTTVSCSSSTGPDPIEAASIEVTIGTVLMASIGEQATATAVARDVSGDVIQLPVAWSSSRPGGQSFAAWRCVRVLPSIRSHPSCREYLLRGWRGSGAPAGNRKYCPFSSRDSRLWGNSPHKVINSIKETC